MINIVNTSIAIFGLKGSGKTELAKHFLRQQKKHLIFDYHGEYSPNKFMRFRVTNKEFEKLREENNIFNREFIIPKQSGVSKVRMVVYDEANQYCPPHPAPLPTAIKDVNDNCRHYQVTPIYIARRPVQLHGDLTELADTKIFFRLTGKNDLIYLDNLRHGLRKVVENLQKYHFAVLNNFGEITVYKPIPL